MQTSQTLYNQLLTPHRVIKDEKYAAIFSKVYFICKNLKIYNPKNHRFHCWLGTSPTCLFKLIFNSLFKLVWKQQASQGQPSSDQLTDLFAFLQFCKKGPGARASHKLSDLSFPLLIKFKPLIRWETVFFLPLTSSLFALRICHPGNFPLLGEGSLWAFEVGREEIRRPRQALLYAKKPGGTPVKPSAIAPLSLQQRWNIPVRLWLNQAVFVSCAQGCMWLVFWKHITLQRTPLPFLGDWLMGSYYLPKTFWTDFSSD